MDTTPKPDGDLIFRGLIRARGSLKAHLLENPSVFRYQVIVAYATVGARVLADPNARPSQFNSHADDDDDDLIFRARIRVRGPLKERLLEEPPRFRARTLAMLASVGWQWMTGADAQQSPPPAEPDIKYAGGVEQLTTDLGKLGASWRPRQT